MKRYLTILLLITSLIACKKDKTKECYVCSFFSAGIGNPIIPPDTSICIHDYSEMPLWSDKNGTPLNSSCKLK